MSRYNFIIRLAAVAAWLSGGAVLAGCGAADDTPQPGPPVRGALAVEVTDAGYAGTRTSEDGWRTLFTAGDRVGLYVVKAEGVITDNLCLTLGENGVWTAQTVEPLYYEAGAVYYAYYPWQADMDGMTDAAAATVEGFFAPLEAGWIPLRNQGTHDNYTRWDLMTCEGTVGAVQADGTRPLTLGMEHRMSVVAVELPGTRYAAPDGFVYATPVEGATFEWGGAECKPYRVEGVYRLLYNPVAAKTVSGGYRTATNGNKSFSFTPDAASGSYKVYRVDGGIADGGERALKAGDLYYADGSILPAETAALLAAGTAPAGCIGIVFQTDLSRISAAEKALFAGAGKPLHGVAMSVKSAGNDATYRWYYYGSKPAPDDYMRDESIEDANYPGYTLPNIFDADYAKCYGLADADINGYFNTEVIKVRRASDLESGRYPAFKAAADFATEAGGPEPGAFTSGWYLPSNGQWFDFLRNVAGANLGEGNLIDWGDGDFRWENNGDVPALLNAAMSAIPDGDKSVYASGNWFWTSSAATPAWARGVGMYGNGGVTCRGDDKGNGGRVRCAFAF